MKTWIVLLMALSISPALADPGDLEYFKQFLFQKESVGDDPDFPEYQYRYLMAHDIRYTDTMGRTITASGSIRMFDDGRFEVVFREMVEMVFPGSPAGTPPSLIPNGCKTFQGQWSVPDKLLVIPGLGAGARDYVADMYPPQAVKVTFDHDLISKGLSGASATFTYGISNVESDAMFCF